MSLPLRLLDLDRRASELEKLQSEMVSAAESPRGTIIFQCSTPLLVQRARTLLKKEPDTIKWIDGFEPGSVFWDVGANIGVFSLYACLRQDITSYAFEPSAANYAGLCQNINLNGMAERLHAYCIAFSGGTKLGVLNLSSNHTGGAVNEFGDEGQMSRYWAGDPTKLMQGAIGYSIDEFLRVFAPPFPNHIKIDVDGLEASILQGAKSTLRDPRLQSVLVELTISDKPECDAMISLLAECGLQLESKGEMQSAAGSQGANHIFRRLR